MQEVVDHWEGGLQAMGGAIEPLISYWDLIDREWDNNVWHHRNMTDMPGILTICNGSGIAQVIQLRYKPWHTQESLGIFLAPDGTMLRKYRNCISKLRSLLIIFEPDD